jgi:sec-independent protein translocase protein TatB
MWNVGGAEILVVLVVALIVLGPTKLPEAARQIGAFVTEFRRVSGGFQRELREAIQDPMIEAEARARGAIEETKRAVTEPFLAGGADDSRRAEKPVSSDRPDEPGPGDDEDADGAK